MVKSRYYVTVPIEKDVHWVHEESCRLLPDMKDRIYLGVFCTYHPAMVQATYHYGKLGVCRFCCRER